MVLVRPRAGGSGVVERDQPEPSGLRGGGDVVASCWPLLAMVNCCTGTFASSVPAVVVKLNEEGLEESSELPVTVTSTVSTALNIRIVQQRYRDGPVLLGALVRLVAFTVIFRVVAVACTEIGAGPPWNLKQFPGEVACTLTVDWIELPFSVMVTVNRHAALKLPCCTLTASVLLVTPVPESVTVFAPALCRKNPGTEGRSLPPIIAGIQLYFCCLIVFSSHPQPRGAVRLAS